MYFLNAFNFFRNDCSMTIRCEHCHNEEVDKYAYNDANYRENVIPEKYCSKCGKNAKGELKEVPQENN